MLLGEGGGGEGDDAAAGWWGMGGFGGGCVERGERCELVEKSHVGCAKRKSGVKGFNFKYYINRIWQCLCLNWRVVVVEV